MNDGYMNLVDEVKRLEEMLLDRGEHFRCLECGKVFHDYDRYSGLEDEKFCDKCGEREHKNRTDEAETKAMLNGWIERGGY